MSQPTPFTRSYSYTNAFAANDAKLTLKTTADPGWLMMNDGTIGSASSGATYANALALNLDKLMWNNISDSYAPVTGGRGGSASADWTANKPIALLKVLGRALAVGGAGSGLTSRSLGQTTGTETQTITQANLPSVNFTNSGITLSDPGHTHSQQSNTMWFQGGGAPDTFASGSGGFNVGGTTASATTGITISSQGSAASGGSGTGHNNMQPTSFWNVMIKL